MAEQENIELNSQAPAPIGFESYGQPEVVEQPEVTNDAKDVNFRPDHVGIEVADSAPTGDRDTMYFRDGVRHIDYVLTYKISDKDRKKEVRREIFERNLLEEGLELEKEDESGQGSSDGQTVYVKVHAPWEVLTRYAELMRLRMPIKEDDPLLEADCCGKCDNCFELDSRFDFADQQYFTAPYDDDNENLFLIKDKNTFFSNAQRSRVAFEVLQRARYSQDNESKSKFGIKQLINNSSYTAAFPLHGGAHRSKHSILAHGALNDRHLLYESWAKPSQFYKYQPLDLIRKYFGEKIGIYFAWLGFYTQMLIPASLIGIVVFIYSLATLWDDVSVKEICDDNLAGNLTLCPMCDKRCPYLKLSDSCLFAKITYVFDNYATVAFAIFMSLWSTMFLELWKRKQAELEYDWDTFDFEEDEQPLRPEYEAEVTCTRVNPVTQTAEPYLPWYAKIPRICIGMTGIFFMILCVLAAVVGVIIYRIVIVSLLYEAGEQNSVSLVSKYAKIATTATAAVISLVVIMILNKIYERVALFFTYHEQHRTDTEFEDSFTLKMFLFQFINYYSTIFYVAFFKGRLRSSPNNSELHFLDYRLEQCDPAGCMVDLFLQLAIVMVGKQLLNNAKELLIPVLCVYCRQRKSRQLEAEGNMYMRWEQDHDLAEYPKLGLFEEYLEMVIQFGFVTIFVAAFPLAPVCALFNNIIEIRLDAYKFITQWRRPLAERAQDIGIWYNILYGISKIAILSNACIIAFTSDFVPKMVYMFIYSSDFSLHGYIDNSLSFFDTSDFTNSTAPDNWDRSVFGDNVASCRYRDYRTPPGDADGEYEYTIQHWHVLAAKLAFIVLFEHVILLLTWIISVLIPDKPESVQLMRLREQHLIKEFFWGAESAKNFVQRNRTKTE